MGVIFGRRRGRGSDWMAPESPTVIRSRRQFRVNQDRARRRRQSHRRGGSDLGVVLRPSTLDRSGWPGGTARCGTVDRGCRHGRRCGERFQGSRADRRILLVPAGRSWRSSPRNYRSGTRNPLLGVQPTIGKGRRGSPVSLPLRSDLLRGGDVHIDHDERRVS
jgi:hypothetical protein